MKTFRFRQFEISQCEGVFKVGTDAILLGTSIPFHKNIKHVLEIGTGTGIVSLMLAQNNPTARFLAIDNQEEAVVCAQKNFEKSSWSNQMSARHVAAQDLRPSQELFDIIASNPPYFEADPFSSNRNRQQARQQISLTLTELARAIDTHLAPLGRAYLILPATSYQSVLNACRVHNLYLKAVTWVQSSVDKPFIRCICSFQRKSEPLEPSLLNIYATPQHQAYSAAYKRRTAAYHQGKGW